MSIIMKTTHDSLALIIIIIKMEKKDGSLTFHGETDFMV